MDYRPGLRTLCWLLLSVVGCAGGETGNSFTGASLTFGPADSDTPDDPQTDSGSDTGSGGAVMTGNNDGSSGTDGGPGDPDTGDSGPGCVPAAETCDGTDEDCDGVPDNGDPGGGDPCETGMSGECATGQTACEGGAIVCNPTGVASVETCDNLDNDCNGMIDDGNPEGGGACNTGMAGVCLTGVEQCEAGALNCVPDVAASPEVCNGLDDDCDGTPDDGNPGGGNACVTGMPGICGSGTNTCTGGAVVCTQNVPAAAVETCGNGLDDDCNGTPDDGCGCPFTLCESPGLPQVPGCDPCVDQVCAVDAFCCNSQWDGICVGQVQTVCLQADCISPACAHLVCDAGLLLDAACDPCVAAVCANDPFCCSNQWDGLCVGGVATQCLLTCPAP